MPVATSRPAAELDLVDLSRQATTALDALLGDAVTASSARPTGWPGSPLMSRPFVNWPPTPSG
jgi:hypothetical protein